MLQLVMRRARNGTRSSRCRAHVLLLHRHRPLRRVLQNYRVFGKLWGGLFVTSDVHIQTFRTQLGEGDY
jgi:hypothetical protein